MQDISALGTGSSAMQGYIYTTGMQVLCIQFLNPTINHPTQGTTYAQQNPTFSSAQSGKSEIGFLSL